MVGPGKCMRSLCHDRMGKRLLDCRRLGGVLSFFTFNNTLICKKDILLATSLPLNQTTIRSGIKITYYLANTIRNILINIRQISPAFNRLCKGNQFISNSLSIQLIKISLILRCILITNFKIVCFPPRCRDINIAFCTRNNQFTF